MKSHLILPLAVCCALCPLATAHADPALQPHLEFTKGTANDWIAEWQGVAGRTYFLQWSLDLLDWDYAPVIEYGGASHSYAGTSMSEKYFVRLHYADTPTADAASDDFDGDGLTNAFEILTLFSDPFVANGADSDADGLNDVWEVHWFGTTTGQTGNGDADGDGISNRLEALTGTDPNTDETTTDPNKASGYTYDSEGRLDAVTGAGAVTYDQDEEGNLESAQ